MNRPFIRQYRAFLISVVVAVAYAAGGYAGNQLAVQSGFASVDWPAAGIALAAML